MGFISPRAVRDFVKQKRDSHTWMKKLRSKPLDRALRSIRFEPASSQVPRLQKHQKVCIILGIRYKRFGFWLDMGTGKTRIALELLAYWIREGIIDGALIVVKSEAAVISWENEIEEWRIRLPVISLLNSPTQDKWDALAEFQGGLILATYPGLTRMVCDKKPSRSKRKSKQGKNQLYISTRKIKILAKLIGAYTTDEATELGNKKSLQWRIMNRLNKFVRIRYELAGRPFGRDPTMMWSQLYLLDGGKSLGENLGMFRAAFFKTEEDYWGRQKHTFKRSMRPTLNRIVRHRTIQYRFEECGTLPPLVHKIEEVSLPMEAQAYYEQFVKQIKSRKSSLLERQNSFIRMRQVSSGFVGFDDDGERVELAFAENPKLDRLLELIQQIPHGRKWVIFYEFKYSGRLIHKELKKLGIKHGWMRGGMKDAREVQHRYDNDPDWPGLLVNHKLGAFSLNLQRGNYYFVYEAPVPAINDEQMRRRLRRKGQKRTVFGYDLICRGTKDARILSFHKQGGDLLKAVLRDPDVL